MDKIPDWHDPSYKTLDVEEIEKPLHQSRIEFCQKCPEITEWKFCKVCGCFLPVKTYFKIFHCPLNKW